jgi:hypothetical protein
MIIYLKKYFYVLTGIAALIIYTFTIAPTVIQIDAGELATVQCTLGIAHPTGYPLFTMLGYLFSQLPLPFSKIFQLNILASLYSAAAVSVFTFTAKFILDNLQSFRIIKVSKTKPKKKKGHASTAQKEETKGLELTENLKIFTSIFSGLFLALSKTFWFQSTSVEVYSLHLLLISIIILALLKAFVNTENEKAISKYWLIFAITLAFGFANHMTTLLVLLGTAYLYFNQNRFNKKSFKQLFIMLLIFFPLLFLIYSYLPIRAAQNPVLNWGNPIDWERLLRHISGKQYQVWLFSSTVAASKQLNYFISNLTNEFSIILFLVFWGIIISFLEARKLFTFLLITFLTTVLYSINYDINDIDSYFLLAYISLAFFAMIGTVKLFQISMQKKLKIIIPIICLTLFAGIQFYSSYAETNQRQNYIYEDYTKALLKNLPQNSIVFTYQWDYLVSPSYYFQIVEHYRKDVTVIDKELLRRSWYYSQLKTNHPQLLAGIQPDVNKFLDALAPFERSENFNANLLENLFRKILTGLISTNIDKHDYFIGPEIIEGEMRRGEFQLPNGCTLVPYLFLFKVVKTTDYVEAPLPNFTIRIPEIKDKYIISLEKIIGSMLARRAIYELQFNKSELAKVYVNKIAAEFPDYSLPPELKKLILN